MSPVVEFDCALVGADARVHAIARSSAEVRPLCGGASVEVRVDAPFEADDELACVRCATAALRQRVAG